LLPTVATSANFSAEEFVDSRGFDPVLVRGGDSEHSGFGSSGAIGGRQKVPEFGRVVGMSGNSNIGKKKGSESGQGFGRDDQGVRG
jgi:hypothetical protein